MWTKLKIWAISLTLAVVGVLFGINRLKARRQRKAIEVTSLKVRVLAERAKEEREIDSANRVMVAEARRRLERQVVATDVELDGIYGRIDARETRILNLTACLDRLRGETDGN